MTFRIKRVLGAALLLIGLALLAVGLWMLLSPAQYAATAKVWTYESVGDIGVVKYLSKHPNERIGREQPFDHYFIETSLEIATSQFVLSNVVMRLSLNEKWKNKYSGDTPLELAKSIQQIKQHVQLAPVPYRMQIAITFIGHDPVEAADVVNAVAEGYCDYLSQDRKILYRRGLEVLKAQFQKEEKSIKEKQTQVDALHQRAEMQNGADLLKQYSVESKELNQLIALHQLLASKIEDERSDGPLLSKVIENALPPEKPCAPNRFLGGELALIGVLILLLGIRLPRTRGGLTCPSYA